MYSKKTHITISTKTFDKFLKMNKENEMLKIKVKLLEKALSEIINFSAEELYYGEVYPADPECDEDDDEELDDDDDDEDVVFD